MSMINIIYGGTSLGVFLSAFWEMKIKRDLTHDAFEEARRNGFKLPLGSIRESMKREEILKSLPAASRSRQKLLSLIKFGFILALLLEVLILQRSS